MPRYVTMYRTLESVTFMWIWRCRWSVKRVHNILSLYAQFITKELLQEHDETKMREIFVTFQVKVLIWLIWENYVKPDVSQQQTNANRMFSTNLKVKLSSTFLIRCFSSWYTRVSSNSLNSYKTFSPASPLAVVLVYKQSTCRATHCLFSELERRPLINVGRRLYVFRVWNLEDWKRYDIPISN